jgi:CheY-like chemotaxis protein
MPPREQVHLSPLLIAEDDPAIRELVHELFADAGYTIIDASDGQEALVLLRLSAEPYVVLLDDRMPELSGEEVLRLILQDRRLRRRHSFILMSGSPHLSRKLRLQRMLRALAIEVVPKPFNIDDLEKAVVRAQARQHSLHSFSLPVPFLRRSH